MKILHICLGNFFIDNYSYQENLLTKFHKQLGLEVEVLASRVTFDSNGNFTLIKSEENQYYNENNILVTRLDYKKGFLSKKLRLYNDVYESLTKSNPDIIFIHGCQFLDINKIVTFLKKNPKVKVYVDNHADFSNSATNFLSKNVLHKIIWRSCAKIIEPFTEKFYGVLPARVDFLKNIYKVPESKIELLVMGADDDEVNASIENNDRKKIREKYKIAKDDFLIVTGGKIDSAKKQTLLLMEAISKIDNPNVKLICFGSVTEELKDAIYEKCNDNVKYIGWIDSKDSYSYFSAADLVVFPGRHSVFWEQVVAMGIPLLVKYWAGTTHVDIGGNCEFLYDDTVSELESKLNHIIDHDETYLKMLRNAQSNKNKQFLYSNIASKSLEV